ncbi:MAG: MFS transporter, partial [Acidimicrobiales bacterium]
MARFFADITPLRRHKQFRRLWMGQVVSGMGSQLTIVAVSYQAYHLSHSTLIVGLIGLGQLVPLLAGAIWGGALADALDRRKVLVLTQLAMAAASAGLVVNAALPHPAVWPLFVCTAAAAGFQGVDWPARRAALPMLVPPEDVTDAIALQTMIQQLALVVGPAVAGVAIAEIGLSAVFGIDVATFGVALVVAVLLPALVPRGGGTPMGLKSMADGFRHLKGQPLLASTYL